MLYCVFFPKEVFFICVESARVLSALHCEYMDHIDRAQVQRTAAAGGQTLSLIGNGAQGLSTQQNPDQSGFGQLREINSSFCTAPTTAGLRKSNGSNITVPLPLVRGSDPLSICFGILVQRTPPRPYVTRPSQ